MVELITEVPPIQTTGLVAATDTEAGSFTTITTEFETGSVQLFALSVTNTL